MAVKRLNGFSNIHYAELLEDKIDGAKYGTPKALEGAISVSAEMSFGEVKFYSDDKVDTLMNNFQGLSGELVVTGLTGAEFQDLFGYQYEKGMTSVKADAVAPNLALLFETKFLDNKVRKYALYNVVLSPASALELATRGEEIQETSFTINFSGIALAQGDVYSFIDSGDTDVDATVLDGWYDKVQGVTELVVTP